MSGKSLGRNHCPRCGSVRLKWASGLPQLWSVYDCQECGYRGALVVENGKLAKKIRKQWLKKKSGKTKKKSARA